MGMIKPRRGRIRVFTGTDTTEAGSAGRFVLGCTTYGHDDLSGRETYEVNYLQVGGRSDGLSNTLQGMQGNEPTTRYVDEAGDDVMYVGTTQQNEGPITPLKSIDDPNGVLKPVAAVA